MQMTVPRPREQALEQIMAYILENKLSADDKLPPEREMCQMWGVNRCTLRSAIAALTEQGIVYASPPLSKRPIFPPRWPPAWRSMIW